jgi:Flp pilus assembly protein TadD
MNDAQKAAMRAALDADLDPSIEKALANVTTMFGARDKARDVVSHMVDGAWRDDLVERMAAAADSVQE